MLFHMDLNGGGAVQQTFVQSHSCRSIFLFTKQTQATQGKYVYD